MVAGASAAPLVISRRGPSAEGDRRDFLDPRHRDQHQRHQQDDAEGERKGRAPDEIMPVPVGEHGRGPGADAVGGGRQHQRLHHGGLASRRIGSDIRMPTRSAMAASFQ